MKGKKMLTVEENEKVMRYIEDEVEYEEMQVKAEMLYAREIEPKEEEYNAAVVLSNLAKKLFWEANDEAKKALDAKDFHLCSAYLAVREKMKELREEIGEKISAHTTDKEYKKARAEWVEMCQMIDAWECDNC